MNFPPSGETLGIEQFPSEDQLEALGVLLRTVVQQEREGLVHDGWQVETDANGVTFSSLSHQFRFGGGFDGATFFARTTHGDGPDIVDSFTLLPYTAWIHSTKINGGDESGQPPPRRLLFFEADELIGQLGLLSAAARAPQRTPRGGILSMLTRLFMGQRVSL